MKSLSWDQVFSRRLSRNHLIDPASSDRMIDVVGEVCGIQAQIMTAAEMGIGARVTGITRNGVKNALWKERSLIKTYGLRGTLYLFPAEDASLWMAALKAGRAREDPRRIEWQGINAKEILKIVDAIADSLDDNRLTRDELGEEIARRLGSWAKEEVFPAFGEMLPRWTTALSQASFAGALCFGPSAGNKVTFVRPDQWIGHWQTHDGEEALREAVRRYLAAYGPATHEDFSSWFYINPQSAGEIFRTLSDELVQVEVEGRDSGFITSSDADYRWQEVVSSVRLLPRYDCYFFGFTPRERVAPRPTRVRVLKGKETKVTYDHPLLLMNGVVQGTWERRQRGKRIELAIESFENLTAYETERVELEATRLGEFLGGDVTTTYARLA